MSTQLGFDLTAQQRKQISSGLSCLLADTYSLCLKTQYFHWNVVGPASHKLHALFEQQYMELSSASNTIAERIRALGRPAPGTFTDFARLTSIKEETSPSSAKQMLAHLLIGHEALIRTARELLVICNCTDDPPTGELLVHRIGIHERTVHILRSLLDS